jgi:hypothetical protein
MTFCPPCAGAVLQESLNRLDKARRADGLAACAPGG